MPLYEYQCEACGHRFEVIQKFSDVPIETCAKCGGVVRKLISSPAIQFKGSGWYITDYARAGKAEGAKAEGGEAAGKGDKAAAEKTDTKTETKTESRTEPKSESSSAAPARTASAAKE